MIKRSSLTSSICLLLALFFAGILPLAVPPGAHAQAGTEFLVNSTLDQVDADLVDDICDAEPGPAVTCTLRAAVMQANLTPGVHIIRLQPVLYRLTIQGANEDQALTGDLDLIGKITIIGSSSGDGRLRSIVDATGLNDRVFDGRSTAATLQGLTISGGALPTTTGLSTQFDGGGIRIGGNLTVLDSIITNNTASRGGGVAAFSGTTTILRSTISNNSATAGDTGLVADGGGGIFTINNVFSLRDSTVQNNTSARDGGGITMAPIFFPSTPMRIERTLIAANSAQNDGGGVYITGNNGGSTLIDNSTVSGNRSSRFGGGISAELLEFDKPLVLRASTIAGNSVPFFNGGGLAARDTSIVEATNVIFSNNLGGNCSVLRFENSTFNISSDSFCGFSSSDGSKNNTSARLGPLAFNGGPTRTHALLEGSPAIDAGTFGGSLAILFDQRGGLRIPPGRLPAPLGNPHDIGAFEFNAVGVGTFTLAGPASLMPNQPATLSLTWTHPDRWHDLNTLDVQLRHEETMPLWVRFTEGLTTTAGISITNGLALYNGDGTLAGVGQPGQALVLESDSAMLDLAHSQVQGSGPDGKAVTLTLAVRLKQPAAGNVYSVTLVAGDDDGTLQGPNDAGTLAVGPFKVFVPLAQR